MFAPEGAFGSTARTPAAAGFECPQSFHLYCDDVDAVYQSALNQGATSLIPPADVFWGERYAAVRDPDLVREAARRHPDKVAVGIDARAL